MLMAKGGRVRRGMVALVARDPMMNCANWLAMMMMMGSSQGGRPKRERRRGRGDHDEDP